MSKQFPSALFNPQNQAERRGILPFTTPFLSSFLTKSIAGFLIVPGLVLFTIAPPNVSAQNQRLLGLDVSYYQGDISQGTWNNIRNTDNRQFVIIRSSRGGTTGNFSTSTTGTLSQRYDDPYY